MLLIGTALVTWLLARRGGWGVVLALLVAPPLFAVSAGGNVQPLMLLALLHRLRPALGPAGGGDRRLDEVHAPPPGGGLRRAPGVVEGGLSVVLAAVLLAPGLFMGITGAGVQSGAAPSLLGVSPVLYAAAVGAALLATLLLPRRFALLGAATAAVLALPRLFVYDVTLLSVGAAGRRGSRGGRGRRGRPPSAIHRRTRARDRRRAESRRSIVERAA